MKRLTSDNVFEMGMTDLALNQVFVRDGWAWYRKAPGDECSVCDLIRGAADKGLWQDSIELDPNLTDEALGDVMLDWLQFGEKEPEGVLAILYRALWAMAELRERLKLYEDAMPLELAQELAQAEKDGRLVVLPCKVGDRVYRVITACDAAPVMTEIEIKTFGQAADLIGRIGEKQLLVSWYLTREEAEAALKKREEAGNEAD